MRIRVQDWFNWAGRFRMPERLVVRLGTLTLATCLLPVMMACATYQPEMIDVEAGPGEIYTQTRGEVTVSTTILSDEQARKLYGVDLAAEGVQALWLRIDNRSDLSYWLLVSALDANYFAPNEAAAMFQHDLNDEDDARETQHFHELAIGLKSLAGTVNEGYVLAPRAEGGRYVHVALTGHKSVLRYGFAIPLPDGEFDFENLDPEHIYTEQDRPELDEDQLRKIVNELPCCVTNHDGDGSGDPLNLLIVGDAVDVLSSMARAGWSFTHRIDFKTVRRMLGAAVSGNAYSVAPVSSLYFMGRPQDLALQRARNTITRRNHLRLWLAPFRHQGKSVWVGQVSRDIGVKATTHSPSLTTHVIDPNVDESREHLLQSLMISGALERFGFAGGVPAAPPSAPHRNLSDDPYYTDGLRLVLFLSVDSNTTIDEIEFLEWRYSTDPLVIDP